MTVAHTLHGLPQQLVNNWTRCAAGDIDAQTAALNADDLNTQIATRAQSKRIAKGIELVTRPDSSVGNKVHIVPGWDFDVLDPVPEDRVFEGPVQDLRRRPALEIHGWDDLGEPMVRRRQPASRPWLRPSWIIAGALAAMMGFQQLTGWSAPLGFSGIPESWRPKESPPNSEKGDFLKDGAQGYVETSACLRRTAPDGWSGAAAGAYEDATRTLMVLAEQTADLDRQTRGVVKGHGEVVELTRFVLGMEQDFLIVMLGVVIYLEQACASVVFPPYLWWLAAGVSLAALAAGAGQLIACSEQSKKHARTAASMRYAEIARVAQQVTAAYGCAARS